MTVYLSALAGAGAQFFTSGGVPLAGGKIYTYTAGSTTAATDSDLFKASSQSSSGNMEMMAHWLHSNSNPSLTDSIA